MCVCVCVCLLRAKLVVQLITRGKTEAVQSSQRLLHQVPGDSRLRGMNGADEGGKSS